MPDTMRAVREPSIGTKTRKFFSEKVQTIKTVSPWGPNKSPNKQIQTIKFKQGTISQSMITNWPTDIIFNGCRPCTKALPGYPPSQFHQREHPLAKFSLHSNVRRTASRSPTEGASDAFQLGMKADRLDRQLRSCKPRCQGTRVVWPEHVEWELQRGGCP